MYPLALNHLFGRSPKFERTNGNRETRSVQEVRGPLRGEKRRISLMRLMDTQYVFGIYERRNSRKYSRNITSAAAMANMHSFPIETLVRL